MSVKVFIDGSKENRSIIFNIIQESSTSDYYFGNLKNYDFLDLYNALINDKDYRIDFKSNTDNYSRSSITINGSEVSFSMSDSNVKLSSLIIIPKEWCKDAFCQLANL